MWKAFALLAACSGPPAAIPIAAHPPRARAIHRDEPLDAVVLEWRATEEDYHERTTVTLVVDHDDYPLGVIVGDDDDAATGPERCTSETDGKTAAFYCGGSYRALSVALADGELVVTLTDSFGSYHGGRPIPPRVVLQVPVRGTRLVVKPYPSPDAVLHDLSDADDGDGGDGE